LGSRSRQGIDFRRDPLGDKPYGLLVGLVRVARRAVASFGTIAQDVAHH
jgi:hypothetical protein